SFAQERLWFLDQLEPANPFYNVATAIRMSGELDVRALESALQHVIARHDSLRTTFRACDGRPEQVVRPHLDWSLEITTLAGLASEQREAAWRRQAESESLRSFDLERGPLIRGTLIELDRTDHVLLLTLHHIVCDGWSMAVLRQEVAEHYAATVEGRQANLEP